MSVAQPVGFMQSPADYWGVIDNDIKPALDLRATVSVDLNQELDVVKALTQSVSLGRMDGSNGRIAVEESPLNIGGRIHQSGNPEAGISGVAVTLLERGLDTATNDEGFFQFFGVLPGSYTLVVSTPNAEEETRTIEVPSGNYDVGI